MCGICVSTIILKQAIQLKSIPSRLFLDAVLNAGKAHGRAIVESTLMPVIRDYNSFSKLSSELILKTMKEQAPTTVTHFLRYGTTLLVPMLSCLVFILTSRPPLPPRYIAAFSMQLQNNPHPMLASNPFCINCLLCFSQRSTLQLCRLFLATPTFHVHSQLASGTVSIQYLNNFGKRLLPWPHLPPFHRPRHTAR